MKKKILIVIIVFLLLLVLIVSFTTSGFLKDSISFVTIENGFLSDKIDLLSQVESEIKYQFFNGYVIELYVNKSDRVNKDDKLLQYYDNYGNKKTLYSQNAGIVSDICDRYISLYEDNYYLLADVAIEKYNQIQLNDKGFFYINNICYQTTVIEKTNQVKQINGKDYYQIKLTLPVKDLLLKQSVLVSLYSDEINEEKYGEKISPRANIKFIVKAIKKFIKDFDNPTEKNLLFSGGTGLGKTFLSNCIVAELLPAR